MDDATAKLDFLKTVDHFARHQIDYIVVGGQAAYLHGSPLVTLDADVCYLRNAQNLDRIAKALTEIHSTLRGASGDPHFQLDENSLPLRSNLTFDTDFGPLDLLGWVEPLGTYDEIVGRVVEFDVGTTRVKTISLDDLITIKRHLGRLKDQAALFQLEAIKRIRDEKK